MELSWKDYIATAIIFLVIFIMFFLVLEKEKVELTGMLEPIRFEGFSTDGLIAIGIFVVGIAVFAFSVGLTLIWKPWDSVKAWVLKKYEGIRKYGQRFR